jgi:hypothetical protein
MFPSSESKPPVSEHEIRKMLAKEFLSKRGFEIIPQTEVHAGFKARGNILIRYPDSTERRIKYEVVCFPSSLDAPLELWEPETFRDEEKAQIERRIQVLNKNLLQEFKKRGLYRR